MTSLIGSLFILFGCLVVIVRKFLGFDLDGNEGAIEEFGSFIVGFSLFAISGFMSGYYVVFVGCSLVTIFNCLIFYDKQYWPSSGVLKKHEINHILSRRRCVHIEKEKSLEHYEIKEEQGMCKIYDLRAGSQREDKDFAVVSPNADSSGLFEQFNVGRWKYRSEDWVRHRFFLYGLYESFMERNGS